MKAFINLVLLTVITNGTAMQLSKDYEKVIIERQIDIYNHAQLSTTYTKLTREYKKITDQLKNGLDSCMKCSNNKLACDMAKELFAQMEKNQRYKMAIKKIKTDLSTFQKTALSIAYDKISETTDLEFPIYKDEFLGLQFGDSIPKYLELNKNKANLYQPILASIILSAKIHMVMQENGYKLMKSFDALATGK